jgi:WD40 repeat protein
VLLANDHGSSGIVVGWNAKDGNQFKKIDDPNEKLAAIGPHAWSADSKRLLAACGDGYLHLWNLDNDQQVKWPANRESIQCIAFVSNTLALTGHKDGLIKFWELPSGRLLKQNMHGHELF